MVCIDKWRIDLSSEDAAKFRKCPLLRTKFETTTRDPSTSHILLTLEILSLRFHPPTGSRMLPSRACSPYGDSCLVATLC